MVLPFFSLKNKIYYNISNKELIANDEVIPIVNGIPRFVNAENYSRAFGVQWNKYRLTQLDSFTGVPLTERRLRRCFGEELFSSLEGKLVLEAGCGAGRFTEILLRKECKLVSADLSEAVDANAKNFPPGEKHMIIQADITALPFEPEQFDVVMCLGVVQHTPNPEKTMAELYGHVKPGGWLVLDHYKHRLSYYTKISWFLRYFYFKSLNPQISIEKVKKIVDFFFPIHRAVRKYRVLQMLLSRISPVLVYFHAYPELNDQQQYEWALLDTHDSLTDYYKHFRSKRSIRNFMIAMGAEEIHVEYGGNGIEARCRKRFI